MIDTPSWAVKLAKARGPRALAELLEYRLSTPDVALLLRTNRMTVHRWATTGKQGYVLAHRDFGLKSERHLRGFRLHDVKRFAEMFELTVDYGQLHPQLQREWHVGPLGSLTEGEDDMAEKNWYSEAEVADLLGYPRRTLASWRKAGKLPAGLLVIPDRPAGQGVALQYNMAVIDSIAAGERRLFPLPEEANADHPHLGGEAGVAVNLREESDTAQDSTDPSDPFRLLSLANEIAEGIVTPEQAKARYLEITGQSVRPSLLGELGTPGIDIDDEDEADRDRQLDEYADPDADRDRQLDEWAEMDEAL